MKHWMNISKQLTMLTQFGLSFITPLLVCIGVCWWLTDSFGFGEWIYIPGFFFGLGSSFMVAYKLYLTVTKREKKENRKKKVSFNRHL
ncbi:MAG: AtpZ/AtpI family protein [Eubacteriales bacterium]|nr:AtpZ/AtpI family protein [Eubacteriales bacterium]